MIFRGFPAVYEPFVHTPEMRVLEVQAHGVDYPRDQRKLLGRAYRPADADRIVRRRPLPCLDIFQSFSTVKLFQCVIKDDLEARSGQSEHILSGQLCRRIEYLLIERSVIPPIRRDFT